MMPASNKGVGMSLGFPDVCTTPAAPSPVPIPYPNMAMNAMAVPFAPNVMISMMPGLNMSSRIPMTWPSFAEARLPNSSRKDTRSRPSW